jgi:hypothetical protein
MAPDKLPYSVPPKKLGLLAQNDAAIHTPPRKTMPDRSVNPTPKTD